MYSRRIVQRNIDAYLSKVPGRSLSYHSVMERLRAVDHFKTLVEIDRESGKILPLRSHTPDGRSVYSPEGKQLLVWKSTLLPDEAAWIHNERILSALDYFYWVEAYAYIKDTDKNTVLMTPWMSQRIFLNIIAEMEDQEIAIFVIILKARQLGISRITTLILLHRVIFDADINAYLASSTEDKTLKLFKLIEFVLTRLPYWMKPISGGPGKLGKVDRTGDLLEFFNGSAITMEHGQQSTGMARGDSPNVAHLSELAEFDDLQGLVDASLMRGMHPSPRAFLALEGTAEGINNPWHKKWEACKAEWPEGRGRLKPLFLPWFVGGLYPKDVDLKARPVPAGYASRMLPWASAHARMAESYVQATPYLSKHLGANWKMPIEQVWYYECERESAIRENRLNAFLQEMPANDDEAFQSTNVSVFDVDTINYYRTNSHAQPLWGCFGLRGPADIIPARLQPSALSVNPNLPPIPILADIGGGHKINFELTPIRFEGWSLEADSDKGSIDKIYVWEPPREGYEYGFGCDTGDGVDKDRTVIEGIRKYSLDGPTKQVLEFASGHMNALDAWPFLLALGSWYTVADDRNFVKQPRMAIECRGHGDQVQNVLRLMNWTNFHPWTDRKIDDRRPELSKYHKLGVFTNEWFRAGMIEMLVKMLRDGEIEISSKFFVKEMQSLEGDEFAQSLRAGYGGHDDRVMALGFILISLYRWDAEYWRAAKSAAYSGRNPIVDHSPYAQALVDQYGNDLVNRDAAPTQDLPVLEQTDLTVERPGSRSGARSRRMYAPWAYGASERTDL